MLPGRHPGRGTCSVCWGGEAGAGAGAQLERDLVKQVREDLGAVAAFKLVTRVAGLPRTRSGKTARKTIADLADGKQIKIPPTIEDPSVYEGIIEALKTLGYAQNLEADQLK